MRLRTCLLLALGLAGSPACRSAVVRERSGLRVEAPDASSAELWLAEAVDIRERILAELVALVPAPPGRAHDARPIRILEASEADRWHAVVLGSADMRTRVIRLRSDDPDLDLTLAHELAHLCLGSDWAVLPAAAQEGLADLLGARALGTLPRVRARRAEGLLWAFGGLRLHVTWRLPGATGEALQGKAELAWHPPEGAAAPAPDASPAELIDRKERFGPETIDPGLDPLCYGVGHALVERLVTHAGLLALHEVCAEALANGEERVPASRLFELAGAPAPAADADYRTLARWQREGWDEPTQRAWLEWRAEPLAPFLAAAIHWDERAGPESTPQERAAELDRLGVQLSLTWAELPPAAVAPVSLRDVPGLCARLTGASRAR